MGRYRQDNKQCNTTEIARSNITIELQKGCTNTDGKDHMGTHNVPVAPSRPAQDLTDASAACVSSYYHSCIPFRTLQPGRWHPRTVSSREERSPCVRSRGGDGRTSSPPPSCCNLTLGTCRGGYVFSHAFCVHKLLAMHHWQSGREIWCRLPPFKVLFKCAGA